MSKLYQKFGTNTDKTQSGVWIEVEDSRFKVAYASTGSNPRYAAVLERRSKPYRRKIDAGLIDNKQLQKLYIGVFVDTILLDWENVQSKDGTDVPYSKEAALKLLNDLPELYDYLSKFAGDITTFQQIEDEEDMGNSSATLSGMPQMTQAKSAA